MIPVLRLLSRVGAAGVHGRVGFCSLLACSVAPQTLRSAAVTRLLT